MSSDSLSHFSALMQTSRAKVRRWTAGSRARHAPDATPAHVTILMADENGPFQWWSMADGRRQEGETRTFSDFPSELRGLPVHLWTPARATTIWLVTSPSQDAKKIRKALPFMLEESTLDEPENLHFAYASHSGGALTVAVTARAALRRWLSRLNEAGFEVVSAAPVSLGLICEPPLSGSVAFFGERCCARTSETNAFSCSAASDTPPPELVAHLSEAARQGVPLRRLTLQKAPAGLDKKKWENILGVELDVRPGVSLRPSAPLNLLQGEFAPAAAWKKYFEAWRPFVTVVALWLAGSALVNGWDVARLSSEKRKAQKESTQLFRNLFPEATVIVDPALQLKRNLEALRAQAGALHTNDFLLLTASLAPAMASQAGSVIKKLDYDEGALTATVSVPDFRSLELLKASIEKSLAAEWLGAEGHGGSVEARFRLREASR